MIKFSLAKHVLLKEVEKQIKDLIANNPKTYFKLMGYVELLALKFKIELDKHN